MKMIDNNELIEIAESAIKNAEYILETVDILLGKSRYSHAAFFVITALEEFSKYHLLIDIKFIRAFREPRWNKFWKVFNNHSHKYEREAAINYFFRIIFSVEKKLKYEDIKEEVILLLRTLEGFYDFYGFRDEDSIKKLKDRLGNISDVDGMINLLYLVNRKFGKIYKVIRERSIYVDFIEKDRLINAPFLFGNDPGLKSFVENFSGFMRVKINNTKEFHDVYLKKILSSDLNVSQEQITRLSPNLDPEKMFKLY